MDEQEYQQLTKGMLRNNIKLLRTFLPGAMRTEDGWGGEGRAYLRWTELQHLRQTHKLANLLKD